jgi:DNA-directed RNA polymerase specialized sigma24 family protein
MSLPAFDPGQGHWNVFVTTVVERSAEKLLRRHRAEKRDCRRVCSLDALIEADDDDPAGLGDTVRPREQDARRANGSRDPEELAALALDVAEVLARLPAPLREVAELLMTLSVSEAARALGVPRTTLLRRVERLRQCFEDAGLRTYL